MHASRSKRTAGQFEFVGTLFDLGEPDTAAEPLLDRLQRTTWSFSRREKLEQCPRHYYYRHFGATKALADKDPQQPLLAQLKQLQNRHQRAGKILHQVIATYFRKAQAGEVWNVERLIDFGEAIFRKDVEYSRQDPKGANPPQVPYPPSLLQEFYYEFSDAEELYAVSKARLATALEHFGGHPAFEAIHSAGHRKDSLIEQSLKIEPFPCRVKGVIDLLFFEDLPKRVSIIDWKIGDSGHDGNDSLQLATYALWATNHYQINPEQIFVYKAFLGTCDLVPFRATSEILAATRARILQDAERMVTIDSYGRRAKSAAFTPRPRAKVCRLCPYLEACEDGRKTLYA